VCGPGEGAFADLVLFDADRIADQATYENPVKRAPASSA
jgi:N-acyl-D-aspartate/D-glutamate deacylase